MASNQDAEERLNPGWRVEQEAWEPECDWLGALPFPNPGLRGAKCINLDVPRAQRQTLGATGPHAPRW